MPMEYGNHQTQVSTLLFAYAQRLRVNVTLHGRQLEHGLLCGVGVGIGGRRPLTIGTRTHAHKTTLALSLSMKDNLAASFRRLNPAVYAARWPDSR
jgi:hypothetical protein